jgi:membrane protease YdiL (CAAX protease family)
MNNDPNENQSDHPLAWSPVADAMRHDRQPEPTTRQGNPIDPADPGSSVSRLVAVLITIAMVAFVIAWQNTGEEIKLKYLLNKPLPPVVLTEDQPAPGSYGQTDLMGRIYLRGYEMLKDQPIMSQLEPAGVALTPEDRVRNIMLAGEFVDDQAALNRIDSFRTELEYDAIDTMNPRIPDDLILAELNALEIIYTAGIDSLENNQVLQLQSRYGLIGKVAVTHGLDDTDPRRAPLITGIIPLGLFMILAGLVVILGPLLGLIILVFGIVQLSTGRMKFRNHVPAKGGSVFLETYGVFVGGFLIISIATFFVSYSSRPELAGLSLLAQWLLLLLVLWGVFRGMNAGTWRKAIGWHAGEGVFKEIGCGALAYLASLPIYIVGVIITAILLILRDLITTMQNNGAPAEPVSVSNPIFEMIASGSVFSIILLFALATTWAPVVEEAIFRGALFRHMRSSMHWVFAAFLSAVLFAFMHDYGPLMVAPLIALGFMFAFMREWRGSLIAPMTAHFMHNFTLMAFMIMLVQLIKDPM